MRKRMVKLGAALAALAALAVGGSALATAAGGGGSQPAKAPAAVQPDTATSEAPDPAEKAEPAGAADTDTLQDENGKDDATEAPGNEAAEGPEGPEGPEGAEGAKGAEKPGDDGPGGWADEPGNPNADTQQEGQN